MKKFNFLFMKTLVVFSLLCVIPACGDDGKDDKDSNGGNNSGQTVPDPEGTITISMSNNGIKNAYVPIERGAGVIFHSQHNGTEWVAINISNNFAVQSGTITNLGIVNGLGSITTIPTSGYSSQTSVELNHGYVIQLECGIYARLYVVDWIVNTSNGIIGAKVKYQFPFNP